MTTKGLLLGIILLIIAATSTSLIFKIFQGGQEALPDTEEVQATGE